MRTLGALIYSSGSAVINALAPNVDGGTRILFAFSAGETTGQKRFEAPVQGCLQLGEPMTDDRKGAEIERAWDAYLQNTVAARLRAQRVQLERLWKKQDGRCFYCEVETWLRRPEFEVNSSLKTMATREHLTRRADGGADNDENVVMACFDCNTRRGEASPDEWKAVRRALAL